MWDQHLDLSHANEEVNADVLPPADRCGIKRVRSVRHANDVLPGSLDPEYSLFIASTPLMEHSNCRTNSTVSVNRNSRLVLEAAEKSIQLLERFFRTMVLDEVRT